MRNNNPIWLLCSCILLVGFDVSASSVLASSFGYNPSNATDAFQSAINYPNDTVIVNLQTRDWNIGPSSFFDLTDKTIIFESGVVLRALPGEFNFIFANLVRFVNCNGVTMIGYGASFIMNKPEYTTLADSEWRHTINIINCENMVVKGLTLRDSGGDGIHIGGDEECGISYTINALI